MKIKTLLLGLLALFICFIAGSTGAENKAQPTGVKGGVMVKIPAGEFIMGSDDYAYNEKPAHRVYLDEYFIDKYEVTNKQYGQCLSAGACSAIRNDDGPAFTNPQQPVSGVDWDQASTYCSWAGKRLPTEAEWEKAARGTDGRKYPWGKGIGCEKVNYRGCWNGDLKPVGSYPSGASPYGVMDMAGNVWERVSDWYDGSYYQNSPKRNPTGPTSGKYRVLRGGSWLEHPDELRSSYRIPYNHEFRGDWDIGIRCAKTP